MLKLYAENLLTLADEMMKHNQDVGYVDVAFAPGIENELHRVPARRLILNLLFWEPNVSFGLLPELTDYINIQSFTMDSIRDLQTGLYRKAITGLPNIPHMRIAMAYVYNVDRISNFTQRYIGNYMPSIDVLALSRLIEHPLIKELAEKQYDNKLGTHVVELQLKKATKVLRDRLRQIKTEDNCLYPYIRAETLKSNQIPQFLLSYGPRSDIDDSMNRYVINQSSFKGLKTVNDFAIESLSAKKSIYFSRDVIRRSQYFGRKMRLACASIMKIYPGSCGSPGWIPFTIKGEHAAQYYDRIIIDDNGNRIILNEQNIVNFVDKPIKLISQFACRHTDGICEHCAGYGEDMLIRYMPQDIHIGLISSSKVSSTVSQKILSAKHLINTTSKVYTLPETASQFFYKVDDGIYWKKEIVSHFNELQIKIPVESLNAPISDLSLDTLPNAEAFSKIPYIEFYKDDELIGNADLEEDIYVPYLSSEALDWMRAHYKAITADEDMITIPLSEFNERDPFMKYTIMNDDMLSYTERVAEFLAKKISNYTTIESCIHDFNDTVYQKSKLNSFFLETVLRSHLIAGPDDYRIPVVTDPNHVCFGKLADVISETSVTGKLAFEHVKKYISTAATPLVPKPVGWFGPMFGICDN